jgi:Apea-like HEPN
MELFDRSQRMAEDILRVLRLVHHGIFSIAGAVHLSKTWFDEDEEPRYDFIQGSSRSSLMTSVFSTKQCEEVEEFYKALQEPRVVQHRGLVQAARRYGFAIESHREEDRIVDVMIAAEALFLSDAGSAQERGELKYRLSLRAAYFMGKDINERKTIFRFMKNAYDARSTIAHGGQPTKLKGLNGEQIGLHQFTHFTAHYVRRGLRKAIREAPPEGPFMDWDSLILSG